MIPPIQNLPKADQPERPNVKYLPQRCRFLRKEVWAILTSQVDGSWKIVNCLDKHQSCFEHSCAFTTDGGEWPFGGLGELPNVPPERSAPLADPSFEGK